MSCHPEKSISALILCGGQSTRMGAPKAWLPFGGEFLLQRVVRLVREAIGSAPLVVVKAPGQAIPDLMPGTQVVSDPVNGRGPLLGLATGLEVLSEHAELVYATSTDMPFLAPGWISRQVHRINEHDIAIPYIRGQFQPLAALYQRKHTLIAAHNLLASGLSKPTLLMQYLSVKLLYEDDLLDVDPELATLRNLNTPGEYAAALGNTDLNSS